ncbi:MULTISPECIES: rRNA adenine N-6-methyltransferase family protein [unclassified Streptomyces]|uniref:protein-L-isoaspartate O-methyltransferase family protein n=1 Tax=Streptomyces TaxID=1883 RepID=UPI0022AFC4C0|nr:MULTISPECIES: rRNA adenine N-6-methyltransferase family protein [unclassified Streptomyces]MCZ4098566.1 hypothetical protein [Streptomyces sp. H39-C1]
MTSLSTATTSGASPRLTTPCSPIHATHRGSSPDPGPGRRNCAGRRDEHHLDSGPDDTVLEIGTGSGYSTALLAHRVRPDGLVTVESDPHLADRARTALAGRGLRPAVVTADGEQGYPARAPCTRTRRRQRGSPLMRPPTRHVDRNVVPAQLGGMTGTDGGSPIWPLAVRERQSRSCFGEVLVNGD